MALKGVLRPGYIQIRVTDLDSALKHYVDRIGLHEVSREPDGRIYFGSVFMRSAMSLMAASI